MTTTNSTTTSTVSQHHYPTEFEFNVANTIPMVYLASCEVFEVVLKSRNFKMFGPQRKWSDVIRPRNMGFLMCVCMTSSAMFASVTFVLGDIWYFLPDSPAYSSVLLITGLAAIFTMYFTLWLRQATFHSDPAMKHLTNAMLRSFSYFEGVFIVLSFAGVSFIAVHQLVSQDCGDPACLPDWAIMVSFGAQAQAQISLLILFVYPIVKHRNNLRNRTVNTEGGELMGVVNRAAIVTAVSICIDISCLGIFLATEFWPLLNTLILLNQICVMCCFTDWRRKFFPCCPTNERRSEEDLQRRSRSHGTNSIAAGSL